LASVEGGEYLDNLSNF